MSSPKERIKQLDELAKLDSIFENQYKSSPISKLYILARNVLVNFRNFKSLPGNEQKAYILGLKFSQIVALYIPKHPDYSKVPELKRQEWRDALKNVIDDVTLLKKQLLTKYESEQQKEKAPISSVPVPSQNIYPITSTDAVVAFNTDTKNPTKNDLNLLKTVRVSPKLAIAFQDLASNNTKQNIETCGTLCGKFVNDQYLITDVLLPKQVGTSDSCTTIQEEDILEFLDSTNTLVLGWIHTHPSQSAFLSSIDLHSQLSYQLMIPEAIAIVVAPNYQQIEYFSLTPDYGINFIRNCKLSGFHPHNSTRDLFFNSPHIVYDESLEFNLEDHRSS
ncbi:hypothetical protein Ciccas_003803 [Cichlidogyrus casuarinus]|uniref:MPN domain-containing protein n=1 Tax=Cichlidogyrus casuarinus TaxID=1844966 RepID=A0ABD2QDB0_9PLAT